MRGIPSGILHGVQDGPTHTWLEIFAVCRSCARSGSLYGVQISTRPVRAQSEVAHVRTSLRAQTDFALSMAMVRGPRFPGLKLELSKALVRACAD